MNLNSFNLKNKFKVEIQENLKLWCGSSIKNISASQTHLINNINQKFNELIYKQVTFDKKNFTYRLSCRIILNIHIANVCNGIIRDATALNGLPKIV